MNDVILGRYWPGDSIVHRMDPRAKITLLVVLIAILFVAQNFWALGVCAAFTILFYVVARIPAGVAAKSVAPLAALVLFTAVLNLFFVQDGTVFFQWGIIVLSEGGVRSAVFLCVRLLILLLVASFLTLTTTTLDLTDGIEAVLAPFARFGFPAHEFSMVMGIALRFLPQFVSELRIIRQAQLSRGATIAANPFRGGMAGLTSLMVPLFTSAFRHADTLSLAMDARCYHGGVGRTKLSPLHFTWRDAAGTVVVLAMLACVIAVNVLAA